MFKVEKFRVSQKSETILAEAGLLDIEAVVGREFDWFETPNQRRGGWSGVSRIVLNPEASQEDQEAVFLKIQKNHCYRSPNKYFRKQLTFVRELEAMEQVAAIIRYTPEVLFFAQWSSGADAGAILITKSLDGWLSLADWLRGEKGLVPPDETTFLNVLKEIAMTSRQLNNAGWVHFGFSAKHIFVRPRVNADTAFDICLIDYEKCRKHAFFGYRTMKDCSHFIRHTPKFSDAHKRYYLKSYFQTETFTPAHRWLIRKMRGAPKNL